MLHLLLIELVVQKFLLVAHLLALGRKHTTVVLQHFIIHLILRTKLYTVKCQLLQHDLIADWVNAGAVWRHGNTYIASCGNLRIQIDGHICYLLTCINNPLNRNLGILLLIHRMTTFALPYLLC